MIGFVLPNGRNNPAALVGISPSGSAAASMLFNSIDFILFAVVFFTGWWMVRKPKHRLAWLVVASFFFYGFWNWQFCFLLAGSGFVDFFAGLAIGRWPRRKRVWLAASLLGNLGSLGIFKYLGFFATNAAALVAPFGLSLDVAALQLTLPVGISFYTFQSMSYTIDVYRGELAPTRSVVSFFAYLAMFPQLVAGPIVRASTLLPQIARLTPPTAEGRFAGWQLIASGFVRKCVIADNIAPVVQRAFASVDAHSAGGYWWIMGVLFAFQIYCDFSGYSEIARGLARLMGLRFPQNFRHPYISTSFRDFWARWHISLSSWFRDYVYIPLGGRRARLSLVNLWITMLISGLWHGANWTFVAWGAFHALLLTLERFTKWPSRLMEALGYAGRPVVVALIFALTVVSWILFRAETLGDATVVLSHMFDPSGFFQGAKIPLKVVPFVGLLAVWEGFAYMREYHGVRVSPKLRPLAPLGVALLLVFAVVFRGPGSAFIYFQF